MKSKFNTTLFSALAASVLMATVFGCGGDKPAGGDNTSKPEDKTTTTAPERKAPTAEGNKATGDTIKIGSVVSLNGELKPWGDDCDKGVKLALEEFNAAGGVGGKKIELLTEDSGSKPEQGKSAAEKELAAGALAILGEVASGITLQMANSCFAQGVPIVAVGATKTTITDIGTNVFRVCYTDDFQGPVMAKFAYDDLGLRKVALMTDKAQPYSTGLSDAFRKKFTELGGEIVDEQFYQSPADKQFGPQLEAIKGKNPDGMFMSGYFTEVGAIARQAKDAGLKVKMMGGDGWDSTELNTSGGSAIVGGYFCNHYNNEEPRPEVQTFLKKWDAKYHGKPATTMGALGYDAALLVFQALKNAKSLDSKALIDAIENTENFQGVSGVITLKGNKGNPPKRALVVEVTPTGQKFVKAFEPGSL
jgi:branched-chain amino acid transport system substrate-binding protein